MIQYHYDKGKNAAQACEKICAIYGEDTLSKSAAGNDSLAFVLEISMWKMNLASVDQSLKSPMKSW